MKLPHVRCSGSFTFRLGDSLSRQSAGVPDGYGVYCIRAGSPHGELLYVGKGGSIQSDGQYRRQNLRQRLTNRQNGVSRQCYFTDKLRSEPALGSLLIEWYIVDEHKVLPGFCESLLLQHHYALHHRLPRWNRTS